MKANEFVKKFGWGAVKKIVGDAPEWAYETAGAGDYADKVWSGKYPMAEYVVLSDLKQLLESHELVESYGGLENAKHEVFKRPSQVVVKQAIFDVESCQ